MRCVAREDDRIIYLYFDFFLEFGEKRGQLVSCVLFLELFLRRRDAGHYALAAACAPDASRMH